LNVDAYSNNNENELSNLFKLRLQKDFLLIERKGCTIFRPNLQVSF